MEYNIYGVGFVLSVVFLIILILVGRKQNITNYVMMTFGQPLHCYDCDKIRGNIIVKKAAIVRFTFYPSSLSCPIYMA